MIQFDPLDGKNMVRETVFSDPAGGIRCDGELRWGEQMFDAFLAHCGDARIALASEPLGRDHLLDDFGFVIDDEMRIAFNHRQRFVSEHIGDFEEGGALGGQHGGRGVAQVVKMEILDLRGFERFVPH
jgi:hypothetical protein